MVSPHYPIYGIYGWYLAMDQYLYKYIFSGLFTSINPSYFDVNYRVTSMLISHLTAAVDFNRRDAPSQRRTFRPWLAPIPPSSALPAWHWWFAVSRWEGPWVLEISLEEGGVHIVTWFHHISPCKLDTPMGFHGISEFWHRFVGQKNPMVFLAPKMPGDVPQFRGSPACPARDPSAPVS